MGKIICGNCLKEMQNLELESVDSIVTDPPYALAFMGKDWDSFELKEYQEFCQEWGEQALRVLKSGGYLLAFSGTRTYHRMVVGLEDANFEIKDQIDWLYGSGFPKSHDISKAIDKEIVKDRLFSQVRGFLQSQLEQSDYSIKKINEELNLATSGSGMAGHWFANESQQTLPTKEFWFKLKEILGWKNNKLDEIYHKVKNGEEREKTEKIVESASSIYGTNMNGDGYRTKPATSEAEEWDGWGTGLKPAHEPIVLAQKPREGTYAGNVLKHGVGGLNIDGCRVEGAQGNGVWGTQQINCQSAFNDSPDNENYQTEKHPKGRWPTNTILDPRAAAMLNEQSGDLHKAGNVRKSEIREYNASSYQVGVGNRNPNYHNDSGGASRYFYCAKAHKSERNAGLEELKSKQGGSYKFRQDGSLDGQIPEDIKNDIATLKPINLMRYLVRLVTPPNGIVLDPFAGSGTTGCACEIEGFDYILIEKRERFARVIAPKRVKYWSDPDHWDKLSEHKELPKLEHPKQDKLGEWW